MKQCPGILVLPVIQLQMRTGDAQCQQVGQNITRPHGQQLIGIAQQHHPAEAGDPVQDSGQHFQRHHAGLVHDNQLRVIPSHRFQKVLVGVHPQGTVDRAGYQASAHRQIPRRFAGGGA